MNVQEYIANYLRNEHREQERFEQALMDGTEFVRQKVNRCRENAYQYRDFQEDELYEEYRNETNSEKRQGIRLEVQRRSGKLDDTYCPPEKKKWGYYLDADIVN